MSRRAGLSVDLSRQSEWDRPARKRALSTRGIPLRCYPAHAAATSSLGYPGISGGRRVEQRVLALFIEDGHYARHLAARGEGHLTGAIDNMDDQTIVQQARRFQLAPGALSRFYLNVKAAWFWATEIRPPHISLLRYGRSIVLLRRTDASKRKHIVK